MKKYKRKHLKATAQDQSSQLKQKLYIIQHNLNVAYLEEQRRYLFENSFDYGDKLTLFSMSLLQRSRHPFMLLHLCHQVCQDPTKPSLTKSNKYSLV